MKTMMMSHEFSVRLFLDHAFCLTHTTTDLFRYGSASLGLFSAQGRFRRLCIAVAESAALRGLILAVILVGGQDVVFFVDLGWFGVVIILTLQ